MPAYSITSNQDINVNTFIKRIGEKTGLNFSVEKKDQSDCTVFILCPIGDFFWGIEPLSLTKRKILSLRNGYLFREATLILAEFNLIEHKTNYTTSKYKELSFLKKWRLG